VAVGSVVDVIPLVPQPTGAHKHSTTTPTRYHATHKGGRHSPAEQTVATPSTPPVAPAGQQPPRVLTSVAAGAQPHVPVDTARPAPRHSQAAERRSASPSRPMAAACQREPRTGSTQKSAPCPRTAAATSLWRVLLAAPPRRSAPAAPSVARALRHPPVPSHADPRRTYFLPASGSFPHLAGNGDQQERSVQHVGDAAYDEEALMPETLFHVLHAKITEPSAWILLAGAIVFLGRDAIRLLIFVWGLSIALHGTSGPNRACVLSAYATCRAIEPSAKHCRHIKNRTPCHADTCWTDNTSPADI